MYESFFYCDNIVHINVNYVYMYGGKNETIAI